MDATRRETISPLLGGIQIDRAKNLTSDIGVSGKESVYGLRRKIDFFRRGFGNERSFIMNRMIREEDIPCVTLIVAGINKV